MEIKNTVDISVSSRAKMVSNVHIKIYLVFRLLQFIVISVGNCSPQNPRKPFFHKLRIALTNANEQKGDFKKAHLFVFQLVCSGYIHC